MTAIRRREFLSGAASFAGLAACAPEAPKRPPNILVAVSDDQSWLYTSAAGDPVVRTPAFDRIADSGVFFSHPAYPEALTAMRTGLQEHLEKTSDPRATGGAIIWDSIDFYGQGRL